MLFAIGALPLGRFVSLLTACCRGALVKEPPRHSPPRQLTVTVAHQPYVECLQCDALERARGHLLYRGITRTENHDLELAVRRGPSAPHVCAAEHQGVLQAIGAHELQRLGSAWDSGFSVPSDVCARVPSQARLTF
jgi:hypothetical protein